MKLWRVDDVMTRDVVAVRAGTPYRAVVDLLISSRVSAVPVVGSAGEVLGVVSETDLLHKIEAVGERPRIVGSRRRRHDLMKAGARTAAELMTSPAVVVLPSLSVGAAARRMLGAGVKRLPVENELGRLIGIVTRGDLLRVQLITDPEVRRDLEREVLPRALGDEAARVRVRVADGVVTLGGRVRHRSTADRLAGVVREVPGVVGVVPGIGYEVDDRLLAGVPFGVA